MADFDFPSRFSTSSKVNAERPSATSSLASAKPRCGALECITNDIRELRPMLQHVRYDAIFTYTVNNGHVVTRTQYDQRFFAIASRPWPSENPAVTIPLLT